MVPSKNNLNEYKYIMAEHTDLGKKGEELAALYLVKHGFRILEKNWRFPPFEVDLIAIKEGLLHFVEVKYRSGSRHGPPEDAVNRKKINYLLKAIDQYLFLHPSYTNFRLDILSICGHPDGSNAFFFIEDVYL
jgi:putative endonuclease